MFSRIFFRIGVRNEYSRFPDISRYFVRQRIRPRIFHRIFFEEYFRFVRHSSSIFVIENYIPLFVDLDNVFKFRVHDHVVVSARAPPNFNSNRTFPCRSKLKCPPSAKSGVKSNAYRAYPLL